MTPEQERRYKFTTTLAVVAVVVSVMSALFAAFRSNAGFVEVNKLKATLTVVVPTVEALATKIFTAAAPTATAILPTAIPPSPTTGAAIEPYLSAPLCAGHDNSVFHTLWNAAVGCHYDHEHGQDPFTSEVAALFPGFDLRALLGGVGVGHTNPSGPTENTNKHGGFKWNVQLHHPQTCAGFEGAPIGVDGSVIQIHGFGNYQIELEASIHSIVGLFRQCTTADPTDYGIVFVNQHVSYGEVVSPYQSDLLTYPYYSVPPYDPAFGMYLSVGCIGQKLIGQRGDCRDTLAQAQANNSDSNWAGKPTGSGARPATTTLLRPLWRVRDTPQMFDWSDQTYPYSFLWLCTSDGGATFNPVGCRYNNSTTQVHEMAGEVPAAWADSGLFTVEIDAHGNTRLTGEAFTTAFGELVGPAVCTMPGMGCHPVKLWRAFVGKFGSVLVFTSGKGVNVVPINPERDVYFCAGPPCAETDAGAVPSGWIGPQN